MDQPEGPSLSRDLRAENEGGVPRGREQQAGRVRVRVEESCFTLERAFLARSSNYFRALFHSGMAESRQDELHLKGGVRARGFLIALAVCRGEDPAIGDPDDLVEAVECAAFLQVACLVRHLCDILDSDNCLLLYQAASIFGVRPLFHSAALFLRDAFVDLKESAESCLPDDLLRYSQSLSAASYIALGTHSPSTEMLHDSFRVVCRLDEKAGRWKHLTDLPTLCSTSMAGVAVLENRLYVVGGVHGYGKDTVDGGFCYDPESGVWTALPGPLQPRYNFTLLGFDGHLYAVGGEFQKRTVSTAERYDVEKREWAFIQQAPRPVASAACAVAKRRMFVCFWKPPDATDVFEYTPEKNAWRLETTLIRAQSYGHCMAAHRDNLYVMRNGPGDDFLRCLMDRYNVTTGQWTALPGNYINSKGALFSAVVRGDSVFTVKHMLTLEYRVTADGWKPRRQMEGFPKSGSLWTCLLRLPETGPDPPRPDAAGAEPERPLTDKTEGFVDAALRL